MFERVRKAVVRIEATDRHGQLSGTGFYIDPAGTLYTSYTIGGESTDLVVCSGEGKLPARRIFADSRSGVALLKVDSETPFISMADAKTLTVGSPVVAVGYPMALPLSPSFGTIAGFDIKFLGGFFSTRHIRANVPVQRGQGGAPLLNMRGEAVGILISSLDQGSACFTLPIDAAEKLRKDYLRFGELRPGWLGIGIEPGSFARSGSNVEINMLNIGAPGQKAGLLTGDVITQINGRTIATPEDVLDASFFISAEDDVELKVIRGSAEHSFQLKASDRPNTSARTAGDIPTTAPMGPTDLRGTRVQLEP